MFAPISAIFALLFFASTLPNGIRLVELAGEGDSVEIVAGYTSGGLSGFASSAGASRLLLEAYAAGAKIDFIDELDRTAVRIRAPKWALPMLTDRLPALFTEVPKADEVPAPSSAPPADFRAKIEEEIRSALLGSMAPSADYSTGDAFIVISATAPDSLRRALAAIPKRTSPAKPAEPINRLPGERTLRFRSELPAGGVVFASPTSGVYYKQWYLMLVLDRLIHRVVPLPLKTTLPLTLRSYYYRMELPVPPGQFPEPAEENLLQELQRLQFTPASARDLSAARQEAIGYLESNPVREWFASHDILTRRQEGIQWIQSMSSDDLRIAARDLLVMNRVLASWSPKARQTSVSSEPLSDADTTAGTRSPAGGRARLEPEGARLEVEGALSRFPAHTDPSILTQLPERLSSGVSLVTAGTNAVFISGGPFTRVDREFSPDDLKGFQQYRPDRILVLTSAESMDRARQIWSDFKGNASGETGVPKGKVSSGDLPALFILKTILDLKIIEAGWSRDTSVRIDAGEGSGLQIRASDDKTAQILEWVKGIASTPLPDAYFAWAREIAIHHFDIVRADLQALTWERDPQATIQDLATVSAGHVQDVARIYF